MHHLAALRGVGWLQVLLVQQLVGLLCCAATCKTVARFVAVLSQRCSATRSLLIYARRGRVQHDAKRSAGQAQHRGTELHRSKDRDPSREDVSRRIQAWRRARKRAAWRAPSNQRRVAERHNSTLGQPRQPGERDRRATATRYSHSARRPTTAAHNTATYKP